MSPLELNIKRLRELLEDLGDCTLDQYEFLEEMKRFGTKGVKYMDKTWESPNASAWDDLARKIDETK